MSERRRSAAALSSRAHAFSVEALIGSNKKRKLRGWEEKELELSMESLATDGEDPAHCLDMDPDSEASPGSDGEGLAERTSCSFGSPDDLAPGPCEPSPPASMEEIQVELQCADLWKRFHDIGTEMIITKAGRLARTHAYTRTELELAIYLQLSGGFMAQDMRKLCDNNRKGQR
ncbi:T-box transcription factor TBX15 [Larimichthys crocea]|uniref:Uncharacterized protein n=1 Tax=Larimichthys crocea TaxID=215358 RepID=A0ACD3QGP4_LARCR|nr:T-box transcription factor TBX15 [Larimichthys crocea]